MNKWLWTACALLGMYAIQPLTCAEASGAYGGGSQGFPRQRADPQVDPGAEARDKLIKKMEKQANLKRQEDLRRDTDKLLRLANELKAYVDKTNENVMSLEVVKKTEEIEKLARSVREKMKAN